MSISKNMLIGLFLTALANVFLPAHSALASDSVGGATFDISAQADLRIARTSGEVSSFDGGFGKLRFGENANGTARTDLRLTEVSVMVRSQISSSLSAQVIGQFNPDSAQEFDLVEAFIRWRPVSLSPTRFSLKGGAVFPKVSLENTGRAWSNIYTLTNSAANSWVAEEFRPVGLEATLQYRAENHDLFFTASAFFANDRAGVALAFRGFTLNAQKVGLWGELPISDIPPGRVGATNRPFVEADGRPGFSLGFAWKHRALGEINIYAADNRADTAVISGSGPLWRTRFVNVAAKRKFGEGWHAVAQAMLGDTVIESPVSDAALIGTRFFSVSGLLARDIGPKLRLALRAEHFDQVDLSTAPFAPDLDENGFALTAAATYRFSKNFALISEWVHTAADRFEQSGLVPTQFKENLLQTNLRVKF